MDRQERVVHAGGERQIARRQPVTFGEQAVARLEVEPELADVAAFDGRLLHLDAVAVAFGQFLDHHGIGAVRQKAAGENARRFARSDRGCERPAGGDFADDLQTDRRGLNVG